MAYPQSFFKQENCIDSIRVHFTGLLGTEVRRHFREHFSTIVEVLQHIVGSVGICRCFGNRSKSFRAKWDWGWFFFAWIFFWGMACHFFPGKMSSRFSPLKKVIRLIFGAGRHMTPTMIFKGWSNMCKLHVIRNNPEGGGRMMPHLGSVQSFYIMAYIGWSLFPKHTGN